MRATGAAFEQTLAEFRAYYGEHKEDHTAPYAGTIEMLDRLRAAGVQLAALTNKDHISAAPLIEKYFGSERFALVQGRVDAFPPKPEAPVTLHVMKELGADPATTLYVGDSNVDVLTGHNAGLKSAGVSWGFRGRAELEAAGADYVVDTQDDSPSWSWASNETAAQRGCDNSSARKAHPVLELRNGMRFPLEPHRGNGIPFWSNIPGRTFRNPPHPETATHYSAKNRVAFSRAPTMHASARSVPNCQAEKERPQLPPKQPRERRCFGNDSESPARASNGALKRGGLSFWSAAEVKWRLPPLAGLQQSSSGGVW